MSPNFTPTPFGDNIYTNGNFEYLYDGWHWRSTTGPEPQQQCIHCGVLDDKIQHDGIYSWRMDLKEYPEKSFITLSGNIDPLKDYQLSLWIRAVNIFPLNSIKIRILVQPTYIWYTLPNNNFNLIQTSGTHDWYQFSVNILGSNLSPGTEKLTVGLYADPESTGQVWFDDIELKEIKTSTPPNEILNNSAAPNWNYVNPGNGIFEPDIQYFKENTNISITTQHKDNIICNSSPVDISFHNPNQEPLKWIIRNYWGDIVSAGSTAEIEQSISFNPLGYFEVIAESEESTASARISLTHLESCNDTLTNYNYPIGFQNDGRRFKDENGNYFDDLDEWVRLNNLGFKWVREFYGWEFLEKSAPIDDLHDYQEYLWERKKNMVERHVDNNYKVLITFSHMAPWAGESFTHVSPFHFENFRLFVRRTINEVGQLASAVEVINEPYITGSYKSLPLEDLLEMHKIVFEEVKDKFPNLPVIGPCLDPGIPDLFMQTEQLLQLGITEYLDGISIHTYSMFNVAKYKTTIKEYLDLWQSYGSKEMPIYVTEHGTSFPEFLPQERIQSRNFVITSLLAMEQKFKLFAWFIPDRHLAPSEFQRRFTTLRTREDLDIVQPRPAYHAGIIMSQILGGAKYKRRIKGIPSTIHGQIFKNIKKKGYVVALWEESNPLTKVKLYVGSKKVTLIKINGDKETITTNMGNIELSITPDPIFILGTKRGVKGIRVHLNSEQQKLTQ